MFILCLQPISIRTGGGLVPKLCPTLATPWTVARQAPLSMGFSRQEEWSGLPFSSPEDLPDPGIEPWSPPWQADSLPSELQGKSPISDRWGSNVLATSVTRGKSRLRLSFLICKTGNNSPYCIAVG